MVEGTPLTTKDLIHFEGVVAKKQALAATKLEAPVCGCRYRYRYIIFASSIF